MTFPNRSQSRPLVYSQVDLVNERIAVFCFHRQLSLSGEVSSAAVAAFSWIMERK